jgi:hypothetical protein
VRGTWRHLIAVRVRAALTLVVLTAITARYSTVAAALEDFEEQLHDAGVQLPTEEPIVTLRQYTGHDTMAFVYRHRESAVKVVPAMRPMSADERVRMLDAFLWFYSRVTDLVGSAGAGASEVTLVRDGFRYHARVDETRDIHVMCACAVRDYNLDDTALPRAHCYSFDLFCIIIHAPAQVRRQCRVRRCEHTRNCEQRRARAAQHAHICVLVHFVNKKSRLLNWARVYYRH